MSLPSLQPVSRLTPHDSARQLAASARWALEQEALLSPKPALVDQRGQGVHSDMHLQLMLDSARCLEPYFAQMAAAAQHSDNPLYLRARLGLLGREAEAAMLATTGGVNTHRGAIWALGLLTAAAAQHSADGLITRTHSDQLLHGAARLARLPDPALLHQRSASKGSTACQRYAVSGAREQAQQGFPQIQQQALPQLRSSRQRGDSETIARLNALLAIMTHLSDTCVLSRAGMAGLRTLQTGAQQVLALGGCGALAGRRALLQLEQQLLALNASAGGAADLLAATLFVDSLCADNNNDKEQ
ncbi:hypothetical protein WH50_12275 [Pokkaliibacter plantistimulans]|uniref:Probable 2-(5''-triphosphoribosyl)-3'-dephosphocoenzyme-A synthase n=1 Tax=Pokkaliibacter plantistimulans TaxID=1635171 RepID=A0ABX5LZZ9_9GAMM|nr:triphosphoribosyl-dephospho-CoA synthase [Pokkaliibacter plantistimulans]PXF31008.1 hypothetical protein WH50_12275 [Pokkaliibacter plantistimulans]